MAATDTRRRILDAPLACFLEEGYEQTTIARIRESSDTSDGARFHHIPSKEAIADALAYLHLGLRNAPRSGPPRD
jgi:AcrR family transcriptional regulator